MKIRLIKSSEYAIADDSVSGNDVVNRPIRDIFTASGLDITEDFGGFAKKIHSHTISEIFGSSLDSEFEFKKQVTLSVADGTAPLAVTSTTLVENLNADLLDGKEASEFALVGTTLSEYGIEDAYTKDEVDSLIDDIDTGGGGGTSVVFGPVGQADKAPDTPNALDDEFTSDTLDEKWSLLNDGASFTQTIIDSQLILDDATVSSTLEFRGIEQDAPATPYTVTAKCAAVLAKGINRIAGILFRNSTSGKLILGTLQSYSDAPKIGFESWTDIDSWNATITSVAINQRDYTLLYLRLTNDGTTIKMYYSYDGYIWFTNGSQDLSSFISSVDKIGLFVLGRDNKISRLYCDWFRVS